ncbi:MFS transporter [Alicyclobacillus cycloheptanicus]|jgi:FSR family fosmidomycin resistance protein-like MFS transporter|uniref:FSR family fosmidomycin resistance protein-like MFS transporter n=1 Tax=Alicyclobacillus cycloheptanicus TaxID=1457 RepID=A0ABT9XEI3_9BACL|nr:MFS transporter [Alicyclobacillus cycloheptanicus]MDQ0188709.1 FSR family fosmidomycin resistance protein-like MFS transporter [Alicyclobacillus cycloheptanicus]WDM00623.1 MFS transporter [Alicyclobacillus cycloheptanicus]
MSTAAPLPTRQPIYRRAVFTFSASHFLNDLMTTGLVPALVVMYKQAFHLNYTQSTLIVLVSYLTSSVAQPIFGALSDRKPRVWWLSVGLFFSCLGLALTGAVDSLGLLLVCVAVSGFGSGAFHPEASRGTHLAAGGKKGLAQSIFQVGGNAGQACGPMMIPLFLHRTGIHGLLWFLPVAVLSLGLTGQILGWINRRIVAERTARKVGQGENNIPGVILLVLLIIFRSWCQVGVVVFLPFYMHHLSLEASEWLNFVFVGAGALGTFLGGMWSDKLGLKRLLVGSMFAATPFAILFPFTHGGVLAVFDLLLFGFCVLSSFAVTVVYMQKLLPKNVAMASGLSIGFGVGAGGIGATLMGSISDAFGVPLVFTILSVLPLVCALIGLFLPSDRGPALSSPGDAGQLKTTS